MKTLSSKLKIDDTDTKTNKTKNQGHRSCFGVTVILCYLTVRKGWHKLFTCATMRTLFMLISILFLERLDCFFSPMGGQKGNSPTILLMKSFQ